MDGPVAGWREHRWTNRWMDGGWMEAEQMDGRVDGQIDGWVNKKDVSMHSYASICIWQDFDSIEIASGGRRRPAWEWFLAIDFIANLRCFANFRKIFFVFACFHKFSDVIKCVRMHSDIFALCGCIWMHLDTFGLIRNFRNVLDVKDLFRETFEFCVLARRHFLFWLEDISILAGRHLCPG